MRRHRVRARVDHLHDPEVGVRGEEVRRGGVDVIRAPVEDLYGQRALEVRAQQPQHHRGRAYTPLQRLF